MEYTSKIKQVLKSINAKNEKDDLSNIILEAVELQEKIENLHGFMLLPSYYNLSLTEQDIMRRQLEGMRQYFECLVMRLEMHVDG